MWRILRLKKMYDTWSYILYDTSLNNRLTTTYLHKCEKPPSLWNVLRRKMFFCYPISFKKCTEHLEIMAAFIKLYSCDTCPSIIIKGPNKYQCHREAIPFYTTLLETVWKGDLLEMMSGEIIYMYNYVLLFFGAFVNHSYFHWTDVIQFAQIKRSVYQLAQLIGRMNNGRLHNNVNNTDRNLYPSFISADMFLGIKII